MIALAAATLLIGGIQAESGTPAVRRPVITEPSWIVRPAFAELTPAAQAAGIEIGVVQLSCDLGREGRLGDCTVLKTSHRDMGLEPVALEAARHGRLSVSTYDRAPANAEVRFDIVLR
ncbi:MAG: hypothetical protein EBR82_19780 [Caulobacteraceae bacterium]|nr:hypothetical protein [Caulobacteraceae bacterium]